MCELLSSKVTWLWGPSQDEVFKKLKSALAHPTVFTLYNPEAKLKVSADTCAYGIGAVLLQQSPNSLSGNHVAYLCILCNEWHKAKVLSDRVGSISWCVGLWKVLWLYSWQADTFENWSQIPCSFVQHCSPTPNASTHPSISSTTDTNPLLNWIHPWKSTLAETLSRAPKKLHPPQKSKLTWNSVSILLYM